MNHGKILSISVASTVFHDFAVKDIFKNKEITELLWVTVEDIKGDEVIFAKARYLFWACFRGHYELITHIIVNDKISPFARIHKGRSPLMASLTGRQRPNRNNTEIPVELMGVGEKISNRA